MAFYAIPSVDHQKDVPIRVFSMALLSLLKGKSLCQWFFDVWKALTLKPDSGSVRHAITEPLTTALYTIPSVNRQKNVPIRVFSIALLSLLKGESLYQVFLHIWKVLTLKPDSERFRDAIMESFNDGILCHPVYPPPKGHPHTSILYETTESSERWSLFQDFLTIRKALTLKPNCGRVRHAITEPFDDSVLCHLICPLPKDVPIQAFSMALQILL
ncbi:hypothetical protein B9Z19DRAFT_1126954 [Tuber borchii]|uniref:Uncharacterized protein n=1 Tax=Tuber borchii TaxID=42251 RepID=A0A2T6ZS48_TUBBO|nr:hypothetical protein B9Z19DRAFT_1126954 [Tuber borchii]